MSEQKEISFYDFYEKVKGEATCETRLFLMHLFDLCIPETRRLSAEIDSLKAEVEYQRKSATLFCKQSQEKNDIIEELRAQIEKMKAASNCTHVEKCRDLVMSGAKVSCTCDKWDFADWRAHRW